ncbi:Vacuolar ATP synthase subunit C [Hanseniaspora osmophila]
MSELSLYTANDYIILSLPKSAQPASDPTIDVDFYLKNLLLDGKTYVSNFTIPEFKIGSLDSLVVQSEELSKIDNNLQQSITKIVDVLTNLNEANSNNYKTLPIDKSSLPEYLSDFHWNTRKFKLDKPVQNLINEITEESLQLDNDVKATSTNYINAKQQLVAAERKQTGDLSVRSLHDIVKADDFILDSEYLTTVLVAVPHSFEKQFLNTYETLADNVVPRSASALSSDSEYTLYNVHLFKKSVHKFVSMCRENKFVPREFHYSEQLIDDLKKEHDQAASLENNLRKELVRLAKAAYSDVFMNWFHIKALRVFVESVLRYGLPPQFNTKILAVPPKTLSKAKTELINNFGYLGGSAFVKDKKGNVKQNDSSLHEYASLVDTDYEPFVMYFVNF